MDARELDADRLTSAGDAPPVPWTAAGLERALARIAAPTEALLERRAAVALVLHLAGDPHVLLMKRAVRDGDPWSGHVSLPGGRSEPEDGPDLARTAVRETCEELGVDLDRDGRPLGRLAPLRARARGTIVPMDVAPFVFAVAERPQLCPCAAEVECAFWFPLDSAASGALDRPYVLQHAGSELHLPSWRWDGHTVWGMTHRILSGLLEVARAPRTER